MIFSGILSKTCQIVYMVLTANQMNVTSSLLQKLTSLTCSYCTSFNNVNFVTTLMINLMEVFIMFIHKKKITFHKVIRESCHVVAKILLHADNSQMTVSLWVTSVCRHDGDWPADFSSSFFFTCIMSCMSYPNFNRYVHKKFLIFIKIHLNF